jgi:hypothetical protein
MKSDLINFCYLQIARVTHIDLENHNNYEKIYC